jgi:hypothetical protein
MASMLSSRPVRNMLRDAIARAITEARPSSIAFAAPLPITSRTPFPALRRLAVTIYWRGGRVGHDARHDCGSIELHRDLGVANLDLLDQGLHEFAKLEGCKRGPAPDVAGIARELAALQCFHHGIAVYELSRARCSLNRCHASSARASSRRSCSPFAGGTVVAPLGLEASTQRAVLDRSAKLAERSREHGTEVGVSHAMSMGRTIEEQRTRTGPASRR